MGALNVQATPSVEVSDKVASVEMAQNVESSGDQHTVERVFSILCVDFVHVIPSGDVSIKARGIWGSGVQSPPTAQNSFKAGDQQMASIGISTGGDINVLFKQEPRSKITHPYS